MYNNCVLKYVLVLIIVVCFTKNSLCDNFHETLHVVRVTTPDDIQTAAAYDVIKRLLPQQYLKFNVSVRSDFGPQGRDTFQITKNNNTAQVSIIGSSGVAAAWGFHHYLKYYCGCHLSWEAAQLSLPQPLVDVNITITSNDRFRYYQNVCTSSYSFVWWNWGQWEKHIDWMALNSINLALAFTGQENIWLRVYLKLNMTDKEIMEHFTGPAFLAWQRMGNLRGWAGPLSDNWHALQLNLQKKILKRMRELGITPVLPGFAGLVPRAFKRLFPNNSLTLMTKWNKFSDEFCCPYLIEPTDPLFNKVGTMFMTELISEFGTNHIYSCDTFNEMQPQNGDPEYIRSVGAAIFSAMNNSDPQAIWMMQNWLFVSEVLFWTENRAKALITSVPIGRMLILDLQSEQWPQYERFESYFGQPFIWCMLHNFGGTLGLFGSVEQISTGPIEARAMANSTMVGTGLTPEGINQNYVVYDLMMESAWRKNPVNLTSWFNDYALRRYGKADSHASEAWQLLKLSVYNYTGLFKIRGKYVLNRQPRLNIKPWWWYHSTDLEFAWDHMISASTNLENSTAFRHDLVDITRQVLQVLGDQYYQDLVQHFKEKNLPAVRDEIDIFLRIFDDMDALLSTNEAFLLGKWLNSAKAMAANSKEEKFYEYNARNQITLWGPNGEIKDYASKQWAGMVLHFFRPRWELFLTAMNESLSTNQTFNESDVIRKVFIQVEQPFTFDQTPFPDTPQGDSIAVARDIHRRWFSTKRSTKIKTKSVKNETKSTTYSGDSLLLFIMSLPKMLGNITFFK